MTQVLIQPQNYVTKTDNVQRNRLLCRQLVGRGMLRCRCWTGTSVKVSDILCGVGNQYLVTRPK